MGIGTVALPEESAVEVIVGRTYTGLVTLRADVTARTARVVLRWLDEDDNLVDTDASAWAPLEADADGSLHRVAAVAPPGTASANLSFEVDTPVSGEDFFMDQAGILTGDYESWTPPGFISAGGFVIERSVEGGAWEELPGATRVSPLTIENPADPIAQTFDYTALQNIEVVYRALAIASGVYSSWSSEEEIFNASSTWWLKDEDDPTVNLAVSVVEWNPRKPVRSGTFYPRGRSNAVVAQGSIFGAEGTLVVRTLNRADYTAVHALLESKRELLLQSVLPQQWRIRINGDIQDTLVKAGAAFGEITPIRFAYEISAPAVEVAA